MLKMKEGKRNAFQAANVRKLFLYLFLFIWIHPASPAVFCASEALMQVPVIPKQDIPHKHLSININQIISLGPAQNSAVTSYFILCKRHSSHYDVSCMQQGAHVILLISYLTTIWITHSEQLHWLPHCSAILPQGFHVSYESCLECSSPTSISLLALPLLLNVFI